MVTRFLFLCFAPLNPRKAKLWHVLKELLKKRWRETRNEKTTLFATPERKLDLKEIDTCTGAHYEGYRMVPFNLKVLAKFGLCSNCSQKLHGCSLARARKIFATARMLAFSLTCAQLLEISLILLCSYFLYIYKR